MTVFKLYTVNCDAEQHAVGCPGWFGDEDTLANLRRSARLAGWKIVRPGHGDLSPQCWKVARA